MVRCEKCKKDVNEILTNIEINKKILWVCRKGFILMQGK
jgi:hypothetical protein